MEKLFAGKSNEMVSLTTSTWGAVTWSTTADWVATREGNRPGASDIEYSEIRRANNQSRLSHLRQATIQPERQDTSEDR